MASLLPCRGQHAAAAAAAASAAPASTGWSHRLPKPRRIGRGQPRPNSFAERTSFLCRGRIQVLSREILTTSPTAVSEPSHHVGPRGQC